MLLPSISNRKVISTRNLNEELSFIFIFRFISTFKPQLYLKNLKTLPFPEQPKSFFLARVGIETEKNFFSCDLVCLVVAYVF